MGPKQYKLHLELLEKLERKQTLSESDMKIIEEIDKTYGTGKYRNENKNILSRLSNDTKSWIMSVTGVSMLMIFLFIMYTYNIILWVLVGMLCLVMFGAISYVVKEIIKMYVFNDYE